MTIIQRQLLALVVAGIGKETSMTESPEFYTDIDCHIDEIVRLAEHHNVSYIALDGWKSLHAAMPDIAWPAETRETRMAKLRWEGKCIKGERRYERHRNAIARLADLLHSYHIDVMLLKGYSLSCLYPIPQHRQTGDIDIYLFGKWKEADALIANTLSTSIDDSSEHHTTFRFEGINVENHYDFVNTKKRLSSQKIEQQFKELASLSNPKIEIGNTKVFVPNNRLNALFLLRHMAGHFAAEGITLRHLLDWAFFLEKHHTDMDWRWISDTAKEYNMYLLMKCINRICIEVLGFSKAIFPADTISTNIKETKLTNKILKEIIDGPDICPGASITQRVVRWWKHRWKHHICYSDSLLSSFWTSMISNI